MENILIVDNFFACAENIRNIALASRYSSAEEMNYDVGWRGYRTDELKTFNHKILDQSCQKIKKIISSFFNLTLSEYDGNFYFHIALDKTRYTLIDFDNSKFHTDNSIFAGIVYLNPNPPSNSGTTIIIDNVDNEVDNKFNRLVAYPSSLIHAPTDLFGDTMETGRLTLSFFI
tara:strand:+ start:224 stop:742 length:519 start_codon:yes stop_codon:yes gene_type:complete